MMPPVPAAKSCSVMRGQSAEGPLDGSLYCNGEVLILR
jgi:hypothetical protein